MSKKDRWQTIIGTSKMILKLIRRNFKHCWRWSRTWNQL